MTIQDKNTILVDTVHRPSSWFKYPLKPLKGDITVCVPFCGSGNESIFLFFNLDISMVLHQVSICLEVNERRQDFGTT